MSARSGRAHSLSVGLLVGLAAAFVLQVALTPLLGESGARVLTAGLVVLGGAAMFYCLPEARRAVARPW